MGIEKSESHAVTPGSIPTEPLLSCRCEGYAATAAVDCGHCYLALPGWSQAAATTATRTKTTAFWIAGFCFEAWGWAICSFWFMLWLPEGLEKWKSGYLDCFKESWFCLLLNIIWWKNSSSAGKESHAESHNWTIHNHVILPKGTLSSLSFSFLLTSYFLLNHLLIVCFSRKRRKDNIKNCLYNFLDVSKQYLKINIMLLPSPSALSLGPSFQESGSGGN